MEEVKTHEAHKDKTEEALERLQLYQAIPAKFSNKLDLSYVSPSSVDDQRKGHFSHSRLRPRSQGTEEISISNESLQAILSRYITHLLDAPSCRESIWDLQAQGPFDKALSSVFSEKALSYLHQKGYNIEDVMAWAWILTAQSAQRATLRLLTIANGSSTQCKAVSRAVPIFVFLFLLRRDTIDAKALRWLLIHARDRLRGRCSVEVSTEASTELTRPAADLMCKLNSPDIGGIYFRMDISTVITMVVRLLRHARKVWPPALVSITAIITTHVTGNGSSCTGPKVATKDTARLAFVYNRMLSLLAQPSSLQPFLSMSYHQRAQFDLLERMATFDPPLCITREGYRAVTKVQVAHKKTAGERQWAELKAKSWPPWKEEKLGLDVADGVTQGTSRALESMTRMREAGYSGGQWEKLATIAAGWDTDMSPTIQTRAMLDVPSSSRIDRSRFPLDNNTTATKNEENQDIWATRIRATRTKSEAWACFLSHCDSGFQPSEVMYAAMFEKMVFDGIRRRRAASTEVKDARILTSDPVNIHPGDGKEVSPAPVSPQEAVYVRCEPPSLEELFIQMIRKGIKPSDQCLASLVSRASSIKTGQRFLRLSGVRGATALADHDVDPRSNLIEDYSVVSDQIFAAYIQLLCRFNQRSFIQNRAYSTLAPGATLKPIRNLSSSTRSHLDPIMHALRLVDIRRPHYRPCWNALLSAFARPSVSLRSTPGDTENPQSEIICWKILQQIVQHMQEIGVNLDWDGFQKVCLGLEKAILASIRSIRNFDQETHDVDATTSPDGVVSPLNLTSRAVKESYLVLRTGHNAVNSYFRNLTGANLSYLDSKLCFPFPITFDGSTNPSSTIPALLAVPTPSHLHAYVRVLGLSQQYEGILALTQWMAKYVTELFTVADAASSGERTFRRTIVSVRVFLERNWETDWRQGKRGIQECGFSASEDVLSKAKETIDGIECWGGWPEDDEVTSYMHREKFDIQ
ncbi:MAG: hypothetical protein M1836_000609 [Candelina mexicana]|nr:MAG: hypothetical protein M1836_000609 [Candelina mexicana]